MPKVMLLYYDKHSPVLWLMNINTSLHYKKWARGSNVADQLPKFLKNIRGLVRPPWGGNEDPKRVAFEKKLAEK